MPPRAFTAGLAQETNAFGPLPTGLGSFSGRFTLGDERFDDAPPFPESLVAGARKRAAAGLVDLIEGPTIGAHPSGLVTRHAYETLRDAILSSLEAAMPIDIVAVHLHGAMIAEGYEDCEGDLLTRMRAIAGPRAAIGAMIDPHAHLSAAMVEAADIIVAYKEYPHTDFRERAEEVWKLLLATQAGQIKPISALWDTRAIGVFHTSRPEVRALVDWMQDVEARGDALSLSLIHSFPWGDTRDFGTRALAICDGDANAAHWLAGDLASRARFIAEATPSSAIKLDEALDLVAKRRASSPCVLADGPDNPGGGAAGDSTFVLAALLARGIEDACLGPLWDPQAVAIAFEAGEGARLSMRIGGKTGPLSGAPLDIEAEVISLRVDAAQTFAGEAFPLGRAALVRAGGVEIVLASKRDQARGPDMFTQFGVDLSRKRIIVVKSSQHFYDGFAPIADQIIYLDGPGSLQNDLTSYAYKHIVRPRWPIDRAAPPPEPIPIRTNTRHAALEEQNCER